MIDEPITQRIREATERVTNAELELTLAMNATVVPARDADNVYVGERLRNALRDLGLARQALELALERLE